MPEVATMTIMLSADDPVLGGFMFLLLFGLGTVIMLLSIITVRLHSGNN